MKFYFFFFISLIFLVIYQKKMEDKDGTRVRVLTKEMKSRIC